MAVKWTAEQQKVIDTRDRNLLVSAAAGSGKTAVLVERILAMVKDPVRPIDIDQLLVVTFTRAAAGEMKERIGRALQQSLEENPENEHLQRQQTLLHHAQISTIHGFCSYVIKNYFQMIDLDPVYRMADEGEIRLMKSDVIQKVMEERFAEKDPAFTRFVESYAAGKQDDGLDALVLKLYEFSMSYPWPEQWLEECRAAYQIDSPEAVQKSIWVQVLMAEAKKRLSSILEGIEENRKTAVSPGGPYLYDEALASDQQMVEELIETESFDGMVRAMAGMKFKALSRKKADDVSEALKDQVKAERDACKKELQKLKEQFFEKDSTEIAEEIADCREPIGVLIDLTEQFAKAFAEKKRSKNILDYADLEHFALEILVQQEDGRLVRTDAARELSEQFREIMIDEYQDSNFIQEALLSAVSGEEEGRWNRFMVGDIKQSIYGFRLARPELFLEKYHTYAKDGESQQRIDLDKNFRSRPEVLATANYVFRKLMSPELGGIVYDEAASLHAGAAFPALPEMEEEKTETWHAAYETELLLLDDKAPELEDDKSRETKMETEAAAVAARIREMVGNEEVVGKETGEYRKIQYRDIVILLRAVSGWAETFSRVLQAAGIPAYSTSKTGYFSTQEIVTVLNYLHLCDNPCQEIPFTAILRSPICGCTDAELAAVRCVDKDVKIYEACGKYAAIGEDEALREKLRRFLTQLEMLRSRVPYTPIHELITQILEETGYGGYASAMPGGVQRRANLEMLVEKAVEFEATSYRGLFNFIRYIEQLQKYEVDFGEVNIYGESADTVRIMSIHKSKGLEFPVVFLSGMGKSFNQMDSRAVLVLHSRMGIGADAIDPEHRVRQATLPRQIIRQSMKLENLAEELRVLYVAMTRPKEKLIMTGMASKLESRVKQCAAHAGRQEELLSYQTLSSASGYLDWILPAFSRNRCFDGLYEQFGLAGNAENPLYAEKIPVTIRLVSPAGLVEGEVLHQMERAVNEQKIMEIPKQPPREEALKELVEERFSYQYPYEDEKQIPVKVTVSQLKKAGMEESEIGKELFVQEEFVPIVPGFMKKDNAEALTGADRGTAYHRLLECLDYRRAYSIKELMAQTEELVAEGKMTKEAAECIYFKSVLAFAKSPVGMRMRNAFLNGTLKREQPFVMSIPASEADPSYPADETILVQGIIDAWFSEGEKLVLVDYKTDRVKEAGELEKRYGKQLMYYQQALERTTGKKVKEKIIYSLALDEELVL